MPRKISLIGFIKTIFQLRKIIKKNNYDVVNSNNRNASFLARVALLTIFFYKVKNIYTARGMYFHDSQRLIPYLITYWLEVFLLLHTDIVLSQSQEDVYKLSRNFFVNPKKLHTIHNGINANRFLMSNVNNPKLLLNGFVICTVGRIVKEKGLIDLLRAFGKFAEENPESTLLIIGGILHQENNEVLDKFLMIAKELNIEDKIHITGLVDNVEDYLSLADLYIHSSYREGVPRSVLEAMSLEKVVVASNIRGAREILANNKCGYLYPKGDVNELEKQMSNINKLTPDELNHIGSAARERVVSLYTEEAYVQRQISGFNRVIN